MKEFILTRTIGEVILQGGVNLNHELVNQGCCRWYQKHALGGHCESESSHMFTNTLLADLAAVR